MQHLLLERSAAGGWSLVLAFLSLTWITRAASAEGTIFQSCGGGVDPVELRIAGCSKSPCILYKGQMATMDVDFEVAHDVDKFKVSVVATAFGRKQDFPVSPSNGCLSLTNAECPLDKGELVTYRLSLPIQSSYPEISLPIQVSLSAGDAVLACFAVTISVTSPN